MNFYSDMTSKQTLVRLLQNVRNIEYLRLIHNRICQSTCGVYNKVHPNAPFSMARLLEDANIFTVCDKLCDYSYGDPYVVHKGKNKFVSMNEKDIRKYMIKNILKLLPHKFTAHRDREYVISDLVEISDIFTSFDVLEPYNIVQQYLNERKRKN